MVDKVLKLIFGSKNDHDLKKLIPLLHAVNAKESWAMGLAPSDFRERTQALRERLKKGESADSLLPEAFALSREACRRTLGERPYDVQILGGIVLHQGKITEMKTGEGKTLASVAPAYLNALSGKGVHIITVNDYLAARDAAWMLPAYEYLGITVGVIQSDMPPETRRESYEKDITFGTNNEFGFDFLRDNMTELREMKCQKNHSYCIVDEIDSILIDEARTPLIISGAVQEDTWCYKAAEAVSHFLEECEKDPATGQYPIEDPMMKSELKGDFKIDEKNKRITLTEQGMGNIERLLQEKKVIEGSVFDESNFEYIHHVTQALKAQKLFHLDQDYVIQEGMVQIVDEFTGRILHGRRYSDGLHQAIEAKEGISIARRNRTMATITLQNYFRMYDKISGMTGTAETESREFARIYNLDVVVIPTNRPVNRIDADDQIFLSEEFKLKAICEEVAAVHQKGQPILIGTVSVEKSEVLSKMLTRKGVRHEVLNAKNHSREAFIVGQAGVKGAVTIATNMAGRGTDIKLGGNPEIKARKKSDPEDDPVLYQEILEEEIRNAKQANEEVKSLGGLYVLGTERHESRRIDNQLRGRSGRQGDPGFSRFYLSLDDELMRLFGGNNLKKTMKRLGMPEDEPMEHRIINKSIERAQSRVEDRNYDIRKHLLQYDDVLNRQRSSIYKLRDSVLENERLSETVLAIGGDILDVLIRDMQGDESRESKSYAVGRFWERIKSNFHFSPARWAGEGASDESEGLKERLIGVLRDDLKEKEDFLGAENFNMFIRMEFLNLLDNRWQEHLENLEALQEAVSLRSYAQKNPLVEYKNEGFEIFDALIDNIRIEIARKVIQVKIRVQEDRRPLEGRQRGETHHAGVGSFSSASPGAGSGPGDAALPPRVQVTRSSPKVGRNAPCPCGSGKKYKNCHGA